jgi:hypothetical protein
MGVSSFYTFNGMIRVLSRAMMLKKIGFVLNAGSE